MKYKDYVFNGKLLFDLHVMLDEYEGKDKRNKYNLGYYEALLFIMQLLEKYEYRG